MSQKNQLSGKPQRRSVRLKDYDYSQPGWYFVTICTKGKACFLGEIQDHSVRLSDIGQIACSIWRSIPDYYPRTAVDEFIVMPNHIHGIIVISPEEIPFIGTNPFEGSPKAGTLQSGSSEMAATSLSIIVRQYKSRVKRWCTVNGFPHFQWQPRYCEHVIRDDNDLNEIRNYIVNNVMKWEDDEYKGFHQELERRTR